MAKSRSEITRVHEAKVGLVPKTYKLWKKDVDEFKETCDRVGVSQSAQLTKMMRQFVQDNPKVE